MCGISGFVMDANVVPEHGAILQKMLKEIAHRGPDDTGTFMAGRVALGAKRLSIIDIPGGHQPIPNEDGSLVLVCNGEIYNYQALRETLIKKGHVFSSKTDIEVIVHLYEEMGEDCLGQLDGMFAFALWDSRRAELFLARDRFGIKPLYYWDDPAGKAFVFASELGAILQFPLVSPRVDRASVCQYLRREYVPAPRSMVQDVYKLPAAHSLRYSGGRLAVRKYWDLSLSGGSGAVREADAEERLLSLLHESVAKHVVSDVPWGVFLSGGVDSSMLVALATQNHGPGVKTFSMGFEEKSFDETAHAREVARVFGAEHHHFSFRCQDLLETMEEAASFLDEPMGDGSYFPTFALSRFARQHVKVVLSGEGADEVFAGYPTYPAHALYSLYARLPFMFRERVVPGLVRALPVSHDNFSLDFRLRKFVSSGETDIFRRHLDWMGAFSAAETGALLTPKMRSCCDEARGEDPGGRDMSGLGTADDVTRLQWLDIKTYLQNDLLAKVDRATMAHGLEARVPYLDHRLVECVFSLPSSFRLRGLTGKYLLKKAASRLLPSRIVRRPKKGFGMPTAVWLTEGLRGMAGKMLERGCLVDTGWVDPEYLHRLLSDHVARRADHRQKIWTLVMLEMWLRKRGQLS